LEHEKVIVVDAFLATYRRQAEAKTAATHRHRLEKLQISRQYWGNRWHPAYWLDMVSSYRSERHAISRVYWQRAVEALRIQDFDGSLRALTSCALWRPEALFTRSFVKAAVAQWRR